MAGTTMSVLDREFLPLRAHVVALAAALDRLHRAGAGPDERLEQIRQALAVLTDSDSERAARVQLIFSDPYQEDWLATFEKSGRS